MPTVTAASTPEQPSALGRHVGRVAAEQRDRDLHRRVVEPPADLGDHPADGEPDRDPAGRAEHELAARPPRSENVPPTAPTADAVEHQRGAVVDQALALDDRDQRGAAAPSRRAIVVAASGSVGATIAPSANAAAHGSPSISACATTATAHAVAITSPTASSEIDAQVVLEVAQAGEERRRVEQRRQEDHQHEVRLELDLRQARARSPCTSPPSTSRIG